MQKKGLTAPQWLLDWGHDWLEDMKALWFPALIFWGELVVKFWAFGPELGEEFRFILLFSVALGLFCDLLCSLWPRRVNWILSALLSALITLWLGVQTVYFTIFKTFMTFYSLSGAGQVLQFWREMLIGIRNAALPLVLLLIPFLLLCLFGRPHAPTGRANGRILALLATLAVTFQVLATVAVLSSTTGVLSAQYLYTEDFVPQLSVNRFGVLTTLRLDLKQLVAPSVPAAALPTPTPEPTPASTPVEPGLPTPEPTPTPVVYDYNVMDFDFQSLSEGASNKTLQSLHAYFSQVEPTQQNEYTGYFAGKNLIWLTAEGFSRFAVDEKLTPTLYQLSHKGFVCENFYNPLWWVSTSDGEYVNTTSLIPKPGVWSMYQSGKNNMYFAMGNQLRRLGYTTNAYHNHTWDYYRRDVSHPNLGYDYKGLGHGLEVKKTWPESDLEMMEVTVPEYVSSAPFHTYYMTVSGHMNYSFMGNVMARKHRDEVADLPMSEESRAYIACNMELDLALQNLIQQLDEAGELENTVICLSADHYPYGMEQDHLDELNGGPLDMRFEVYRSTLILWCADMAEPIYIDKPCSSLDILPTLSNLFGLEYDSRLLMGRDILSNSPGLVILSDRSFITDLGRYDSQSDTFTPNEGVEVPAGYAAQILKQVNDKFQYSKLVLEQDYYDHLGLGE